MKTFTQILVCLSLFISVTFAQTVTENTMRKADDNKMDILVENIGNLISKNRKKLIVIATFVDTEGKTSIESREMSADIENKLSKYQGTFRVLPMKYLNNFVEQKKINLDEITKPEQLKKISKSLGIDSLIVGTISKIGEKNVVNVSVIDVKTGSYIGSSSSVLEIIEKSNEFEQNPRDENDKLSNDKSKKDNEIKNSVPIEFKKDFAFEFKSCKYSNQKVVCEISVSNQLIIVQHLAVMVDSKIIVDDNRSYKVDRIDSIDKSDKLTIAFNNKIPKLVSITFAGIQSEISKIKSLKFSIQTWTGDQNIPLYGYGSPYVVKFENLSVIKEN